MIAEDMAGKRRKLNHSGCFDNMTWDRKGLQREVESYQDGKKVNWSTLVRQYDKRDSHGNIPKNRGQIAKDWTTSQGVNIERFKRPLPKSVGTGERCVRRKKLRGPGG